MKITAIIQSRMGSKRLPGKAMMDIGGKPSLQYVFDRIRPSKYIKEIYLATTTNKNDDILESWAGKNGIKCFRGSETDVLDSFYKIAKKSESDALVRITGDCPLIDCEIVDKVISAYLEDGCDCATNTQPPTYPDGLDAEVFSFNAIEKSWQETKINLDRAHVNPYIYKNRHLFKIKNVTSESDLSSYRWTLDTLDDLNLINLIIGECNKSKKYCHLDDILKILNNNPAWIDLNKNHQRNEGIKLWEN